MNWPEIYLHMKAGAALDETHRQQVEAALEKYPFFALGRMMAAKLATKLGDPRASSLRFLASLYAPSRQYYAFFLEEKLRPRVPPPPRLTHTSREATTPPTSAQSQEEPSAGEEPGPADMSLSAAFWPPLQGWLAARCVLYASIGSRIRKQIRWEPLPLSFPTEEKPLLADETISSSADSETVPSPTDSPSPVGKSLPASAQDALPEILWELPPLLRRPEPVAPTPEPTPTLLLHSVQFELSESVLPSKTKSASPPPDTLPEERLHPVSESFAPSLSTNPEASPFPQESPPESPSIGPELQSQFHRPFVPLEETAPSIHLSTESPAPLPTPSLYTSESPLRPLIPLDIDLEGSIHLPVPDATTEPSAVSPASASEKVDAKVNEEATERTPSSTEEVVPSPPSAPSLTTQPWQSFLREIEMQVPLGELKSGPLSKELENLRKEFIRRLLHQRPLETSPAEPQARSEWIDILIEKLRTFPKNPPESYPAELSAPAWEPPPQHPRIYTETMARLYWGQGDLARAIEVYEVLCQRHPEKREHYLSQIARIRAGESP
ncbi:MAG: hypothetical protein N2170_05280 [Bacteroidia bacterium]|nr:hypothetical protein [Bacteroidia bacterium]